MYSTYEVDDERRQIRRLEGVFDTTPRQGASGEWMEYHALQLVQIPGDERPSLLILWDDEGRGTVTSQIWEPNEEDQ